MNCGICKSNTNKLVWNDKIRNSKLGFTSKNYKIVKCLKCGVVQLNKKLKYLEDSALARSIYNKNNSIKEFINFHKSREKKKIKFIEKLVYWSVGISAIDVIINTIILIIKLYYNN